MLYKYSKAKHCNKERPTRKQVGRRKKILYSSRLADLGFTERSGLFEVFCYLKFWLDIFAYSFVFMISTKTMKQPSDFIALSLEKRERIYLEKDGAEMRFWPVLAAAGRVLFINYVGSFGVVFAPLPSF